MKAVLSFSLKLLYPPPSPLTLSTLMSQFKSFYLKSGSVSDFKCTVKPRFNEPLCNEVLGITNDIFQPSNNVMYGKEPRFNKPLYNEVLGITKDIFQPSNNVMYGKEPRYNPSVSNLWKSMIGKAIDQSIKLVN